MTYAERLAEFVRVTGSKPGEMNKRVEVVSEGPPKRTLAEILADPPVLGLEPPAQSAGSGRCNRFTRAAALGDPTPCKLLVNHEGPHEP